ncbi:LPS sulfotransferase NodH [Arsukibacterium tuosuense]|uniref:LPS sulfotransferase NodH n=1 Tax=Arsukibacterium tuosuense TaxID=1323745 RepID=A0A285IUJ3_9GAMM|nr:Stf0 family sulfotransferase [Arsukibacterium tuosuense]SNY51652.1 LPS sulfotransferase NodH [Arsukibacterium tuosuense]
MNLYEDQFSTEHDFPVVEKPSKTLIIASTGRCGSHMLGHALYKTNSFGFPLEYANAGNLARWQQRFGTNNFEQLMSSIMQHRTSANGVFSIKIHYHHIPQFGGFKNVMSLFPNARYILLSRHDVLKQAVSLAIANQTGVWIAGQRPVNEHPVYDAAQINYCLRQTILNNASWRYTLAASGVDYVEMDFGEIKQNLASSISRIAEFVGTEVSTLPTKQATEKQSNDLNIEWTRRFLEDFDLSEELLYSKKEAILPKVTRKLQRILGR